MGKVSKFHGYTSDLYKYIVNCQHGNELLASYDKKRPTFKAFNVYKEVWKLYLELTGVCKCPYHLYRSDA